MIRLFPRRFVAAVAMLAFALFVGEGVLATICTFDEIDACAESEVGPTATTDEVPTSGASAMADAQVAGASSAAACCVPAGSDSDPTPGDDDRAPCPFTPVGVTGSCQGTACLSAAYTQLSPAADALRAFEAPTLARDLLFARALFEPPRA